MEIVALIITTSDPLVQFLFSIPQFQVLLIQKSKERIGLTRGHNNDFVELEAETAIWQLQAPTATESTAKEGIYYTGCGDCS